MRLIDPSVEMIKCDYKDFDDVTRMIEKAGRVCYKSEHKITTDSHIDFIDMLVKRGHYSPLEHGTIYLKIELPWRLEKDEKCFIKYKVLEFYKKNEYSRVAKKINYINDVPYSSTYYITTNYRVLLENDRMDDIKYLSPPENDHIKRYTFNIITSIGIVRELLRHRVFSFANESTRYCNYSKDKFNNEIAFVEPYWLHKATELQQTEFKFYCKTAEDTYLALLGKWDKRKPDRRFKTGFKDNPLTPQAAREVLPLCTKSELIMTGFEDDWEHFLSLRTASSAHPDMQIIANEIKDCLYEVAEENKKE